MSIPHRLDPLFDFKSVALVGASDNSGMGVRPYRALQTLGFQGTYYPVNARNDEVHGMKAYRNITSLPETPDMAIIAVPAAAVPGVIDECAARGVKAATILAAGFADLDENGARMQAHITETARKSGLLVVGPNCLGLVSVANHCSATSTAPPTRVGNVAVV